MAGPCFQHSCRTVLHAKTMENAKSCYQRRSQELILRTFILRTFYITSWQRRLDNILAEMKITGCQMHRHDKNRSMESLIPPFTQHQSCDHLCRLWERNRICFCSAASLKEVSFFLCKVHDHEARERLSSRRWGYSFRKKPTPPFHRCFTDQ